MTASTPCLPVSQLETRLDGNLTPEEANVAEPHLAEWSCTIVTKLISKDLDDRYDSADDVADLLERCLAHGQQPTSTPLPASLQAAAANRWPPIGKLAAFAGFAFSFFLAGVLIVLEWNKGTLNIECEADDVPIRIMQGDEVVEHMTVTKTGVSTRIAAGNYVVEVDGPIAGITVEDGTVTLARGSVETVDIVKSAVDEETSLAWQQTEPYIGPDFESYFPDDVEGGLALDKLWNAANKDARPDQEILQTVRQGLRHTSEHRTLVLGWLGNKYIWNKKPQNAEAIELMYHAADFSGKWADPYGTRHYAVYFGLSVTQPKSPAILRTLAELGMRVDDHNDLGRIAWGASNQKAELIEHLAKFEESDDDSVRTKAEVCRKIYSGELKASVWAADQARQRAENKYRDQLPQFKTALVSGTSEERIKTLQAILSDRISLIMDDAFLPAFEECAEDVNPKVREQVTIIAGAKWVWEAKEQKAEAIKLMLRLSKDDNRSVRYNAVYYGLSTVREKSDEVIRRLLEMACEDREWNLSSRIEWGLSDEHERIERFLTETIDGPDEEKAKAAREIYKKFLGREA